MEKVTRQLPCTPVIDGEPTMCQFTGWRLGALFVHRGAPDSRCGRFTRWTITHAHTGYAVHKGIRSQKRAFAAARKLAALSCWDFTSPSATAAIPPHVMNLIDEIRRNA